MLIINLIDPRTEKLIEAEIDVLQEDELGQINNPESFLFDWKLEQSSFNVYKIEIPETSKIVGLLSLIDIPEEFRIHINLIEASIEHTGKNKKIKNIPGCLIAFACEMAFEKNYGGFVSLIPKTKLIHHYQNEYGFRPYGRMLAVEGTFSKNLILKYLSDE